MINLDYAFHHLESVIGVIAGRPGALERMDISSDGFWRSFSAIIVALPALFFGWVIGAFSRLRFGFHNYRKAASVNGGTS